MGSLAYVAKAPAAATDLTPDGWPEYWAIDLTIPYGSFTWPPGWPLAWTGYTCTASASASISAGAVTLTAYFLDAGALDAEEFLNHVVSVTATMGGATVQVKKALTDSFTDSIQYQASNYTGARYGISQTLYVDVDGGDAGSTVTFTVACRSVTPAVSGTATSVVAAGVAPSIVTHPSNVSGALGASKTFTVVASGSTPLTYQWRMGGVNIGGATSSTYNFTLGWTQHGQNFDCVVTNAFGSATSNTASATVTSASGVSVVSNTYRRLDEPYTTLVSETTAALAYSAIDAGKLANGATQSYRYRSTATMPTAIATIPSATITSATLTYYLYYLVQTLEPCGSLNVYLWNGAWDDFSIPLGSATPSIGLNTVTLNATTLNANAGATFRLLFATSVEAAGGGLDPGGTGQTARTSSSTAAITVALTF